MPGMRRVPANVHREPVGDCRPPVWWVIWLGKPHAQGSVELGRSKRLERHLWHRFFPSIPGREDVWPKDIEGWVNGVCWLTELYEAQQARSDHCHMTETESVHVIQVRKATAQP